MPPDALTSWSLLTAKYDDVGVVLYQSADPVSAAAVWSNLIKPSLPSDRWKQTQLRALSVRLTIIIPGAEPKLWEICLPLVAFPV